MSLSGRLALYGALLVILVQLVVILPWLAFFRVDVLRHQSLDAGLLAAAALSLSSSSVDVDVLNSADLVALDVLYYDGRVIKLGGVHTGEVTSINVDQIGPIGAISGLFSCLRPADDDWLQVFSQSERKPYRLSYVTSETAICGQVWDFGKSLMTVSIFLALVAALMLYFAARRYVVAPILHLTNAITKFRANSPEPSVVIPQNHTIAEIEEAEISLRAMQERILSTLDQREKLATVGESVAKIQHDLRNMLATAQLIVENLEDSADPKVRKNAPRLERAISRAINLSQQTLEFGRLGTRNPKIEEFNVTIMAQETIDAETALSRDYPIEWKFASPPDHHVLSDEEFVQRIFSNLVRNARQILMESGSGQISINIFSDNYGTHLRVRDDGPGMSEKSKLYLFQPFKGSTRKGGTGLGLALAYELAQSMGAKLSLVDSDPKGTVFDLFLPENPEIPLAKRDTNR